MAVAAAAGQREREHVQGEEFSPRQREVLDAVLSLMLDEGESFSMAAVAAKASCSKETLYNWFGDRDGLLTATVQWQASKVRLPVLAREGLDRATLQARLADFAESWLTVLTGEVSIALNSLAVAHAKSARSPLGKTVLDNGRFAIGRRLKPVLEMAREAGLISFDDTEEAFRTFFGLVVRDVQIRALLGDRTLPGAAQIRDEAERAAQQFLTLYGVGE
ncbi:MAG: TetR/AcrR family transcriptional regulator C-terminal domain-containing protein [Anderseniella sp.]|nr:TetR/AcrR family transcriptional regulator C-terminal domain-containing protein [Anderseniella sp.]